MVGEAGVEKIGWYTEPPALAVKCDCVVREGMYYAATSLLMTSLYEHQLIL